MKTNTTTGNALQAIILKICANELRFELWADGILIRANTGHEYFIKSHLTESEEELMKHLTNIYYRHKANLLHKSDTIH